jgi:hypothetical protein
MPSSASRLGLALGLGLLLTQSPAKACIHPPKLYEGSLAARGQEALIIHKGDRQELILKVAYEAQGGAPTSLAWVIPTPSVPDAYGLAPMGLFGDLHAMTQPRAKSRKKKRARDRSRGLDGPVIELLEERSVGPYEIQPIRARGAAAGPALNAWLTKQGYRAVPAASLKHYLERAWTFLAVKINPKKGAQAIAERGAFPPLRLSFASEKIVYPLKFSAQDGPFDATVYLICEASRCQPVLAEQARPFGFKSAGLFRVKPRSKVSKLLEAIAGEGRLSIESPLITKLSARSLNTPGNPLTSLTEDFQIEP